MRGSYLVQRLAWSAATCADGDIYPECYIDSQEASTPPQTGEGPVSEPLEVVQKRKMNREPIASEGKSKAKRRRLNRSQRL